jgi:hypothetical protein
MPRLDQIEHSADRAFLLKARIYLHIRGKDSPDLFTRTVDGLFRLKPQRTTKAVMAGELANEILHFQSLASRRSAWPAPTDSVAPGKSVGLFFVRYPGRIPRHPESARRWSGGRRVCGTRQVRR